MKKYIRNGIYIIAGVIFYAVGISLFLDPNNLAPGGVIGISVILNRLVGMSTGTWYFVLNIPSNSLQIIGIRLRINEIYRPGFYLRKIEKVTSTLPTHK